MPLPPGRVLAFDSGIGGLGVVQALRTTLPPGTRIDYLADNALFPYGEQEDPVLVARILSLMEDRIARVRPDVVLIACNTASTIALDALRARFAVPFVGCVPPVRWAARVSQTRVFGLLSTRGTARRPYLRSLRDTYAADCEMIVHGARALADLAEKAYLGEAVDDRLVAEELRHLFEAPNGERIDTIGLGCTHYTFLNEAFLRLCPPDIHWLDPAIPVAQQVGRILDQRSPSASGTDLPETLCLTGPTPTQEALEKAVARLGYNKITIVEHASV
ncbi:glutamate racemase [Asaia krungthepensis]|uniref:Glutamate racemase n=1 Tax=Asaia krungthepensis NRIC 0535 TaxID=1307925 RepID=A0ABQ0Q5B3_9PROT|nr:aspartate/glutamate racemase family protein [Asaia krungthepensis]GBQ92088.1 glutamate racemase [Asaia krungthepensis NRIC 0535]